MDDKKLQKILSEMDVPEVDENAKKRAVNLAMAEFQQHQQEKSKKIQGFSPITRLMNIINPQDRRDSMENRTRKRLMYGGLATAMALVLVVGATSQMATQKQDSTNNFSTIAGNISSSVANKSPGRVFSGEKESLSIAQLNKSELAEADAESFMAQSPLPKPQEESVRGRAESKVMVAKRMQAPAGVAASSIAPAPPMELSQVMADDYVDTSYVDEGRDQFEDFEINPIKLVTEEPVSTFSVDVDTASYSFVRRQLNNGVLPNKDAVRIEEMVNYFDYDYPLPESREQPFKPTVTILNSPWAEGKKLMHVGIKGFDLQGERPKTNLVFLLDVSGSMNSPNKLPLLVNSLKMLVDNLNEEDKIAIVVYAGAAGTVLEPTSATKKSEIYQALDSLRAGGSTAGAAGINLAYQLAEENFDKDAVNRVVLATDGDFNVGITDREELKEFVEEKRESGIFLSVFGFGQGNYNDHLMQTLAQNGNGVAAYIDTLSEARKVLVDEATSSLFPIAKDVKIQVEFNPKAVSEYRLVGYETRALNREDFNNDKVDAGDIGAGHTVTAIYEITPVGSEAQSVDPLRYGNKEEKVVESDNEFDGEYAFLKIRYKNPDEKKSKLITTPITTKNEYGDIKTLLKADDKPPVPIEDIAFGVSVASFAQILKDEKYIEDMSYDDVISIANSAKGEDPYGYRSEFIQLVRLAKSIDR